MAQSYTGSHQTATDYDNSVFINAPFDDTYKPLFNAIVFTSLACGFTPRCALEYEGDDFRFMKITAIIGDCRLGIHDVSIWDARLNMPLELGIFIGSKMFGDEKQAQKSYLVLEGKSHSSKSYLSDLAGLDAKYHENDERKLIKCLRDWFATKYHKKSPLPHTPYILDNYNAFKRALPEMCKGSHWEPEHLLFPEFTSLAHTWILQTSNEN